VNDDERIESVFHAVDAELRAHYGDERRLHLGTLMRWRLGGPDPLDSMSIYRHPEGHWHYVGLGLAEHLVKETNNAEPPRWPVALLNDIARYVFESRRPLAHGHFLERPGDPRGRCWGLVRDPVLRPVETVNGRFTWLQLVALSEDELARLKGDDYEKFLDAYRSGNPLFVSAVTPEN